MEKTSVESHLIMAERQCRFLDIHMQISGGLLIKDLTKKWDHYIRCKLARIFKIIFKISNQVKNNNHLFLS